MTADTATLLDRARSVSVATLGHYLEAGFCSPEIRRVAGDRAVVGRAVTVRISATDSTALHHVTGTVRPGDVVVVDCGGDRRHAAVGEVVANAVAARGGEAIVTDGACTDVQQLVELGLPVYSRGTSALTTKLHGLSDFGIGVPVVCGDVVVRPGDIVMADANGVLVIDVDTLAAVLPDALSEDAEEPALIARLWAGELLGDLTGASEVVSRVVAARALPGDAR